MPSRHEAVPAPVQIHIAPTPSSRCPAGPLANLEAATSRITDVDVAAESTSLARYNVLVQAGTAMLSQANQSAQIALKLLS